MKRLVLLLCLIGLMMFSGLALAASKTVLIIYSYDEQLAWTKQCDRGIRTALSNDVSIKRLYMDTKRIPREMFEDRARAILEEFRRIHPDLVMVSDDNALRLVGPEIAATGAPVVYFGINGNPRDYFEYLPSNVVGVIERIPLFHWVRILFDIKPDAKSLLVLMDESPTASAIVTSSFNKRKSVFLGGRRIDWVKAGDWETWQQSVKGIEDDMILMPIYHALKNKDGTHVPFDEVIRWTAANSSVPVFATQDYAVGDDGVVGSFVIVGEEHGRMAGLMAQKILAGVSIQNLLAGDDQEGALYFNKKQLERFGLVLPKPIQGRVRYKEMR